MDEEAIFCEALEIPSSEGREAYLSRACASDPGLRGKVEELLLAHAQAGRFLDNAAAAWNAELPTSDHQPVAERPDSVIGPYKLLEQVGEGGMGLVFVAEQSRPVRRKVALKLIKPGMDSKQVVARFEAERQALALMDHPHIARVHDAGTTETGRPYFVMELVRGVRLPDSCCRHPLDLRRRLRLLVQVCESVQHAHMKGVIHRDLKPGNVLVAHDDTVAVPKVIDFGVAKATTQPLTERTLHTALSQVVGTPLYMSPEQAALQWHDVDTRSDVSARGVLLYELLTGTTPLEAETLRRVGLDEVRRRIREEEPTTPSQRVSTLGAARLTTLSGGRGADVRRLPQLLRGELDWVVMRCLEKDRDRRYQSASALAADVQRYLDDEPGEAGARAAAYRLRRFARRNWRLLATAGVFAAVLVTATAVSTWQAVLARDAQRQAATEAAIARAVSDFLQHDLLRHVDTG